MTDSAAFFGLFTGKHKGVWNRLYDYKIYHLFTKEHLQQWLEDSHFRDVRVEYNFSPIGVNAPIDRKIR